MTDDIRTHTILNGRYQVERELGRGGMGSVYLAQDLRHRRPVAIKLARLASPEARVQFQREAEYLQKLHHHSLPRVWETFSDTQRDFLVMEYIPGEDLETLVQTKGPQPEWLVLRWAEELLDGLAYLHGQQPPIIHRDVKPGNLKLRQDETLVLVDFGIAKEYVPGVNTLAGASAVTPGFSPPEQYSDALTDGRSDLYSVGAAMYFLLTGVVPAPAPARASGDRKLVAPSQLVPSISTGTEVVVRKALSLPRDERWASAGEMRQAVGQAGQRLAAKPTAAPAERGGPAAGKASAAAGRPRRWPALVGLLVVVVAVAAAGVFLLSRPGSGQEPEAASVARPATAARTQPAAVAATPARPRATPSPTRPRATAPATRAPAAAGLAGPTSTPSRPPLPPTSTPIATRTPTGAPSTPTSKPTDRPAQTATPAQESRATATSAPTAPPAASVSVALDGPAAGARASGVQQFAWRITASSLAPGQAFELRFWKPGQDAIRDGIGLAGQTTGGQAAVDFAVADDSLGAQFEPGEFEWGVVLVQTSPYRPLRLVSEARRLVYERSQAQPEEQSPPTDTPEPSPPTDTPEPSPPTDTPEPQPTEVL